MNILLKFRYDCRNGSSATARQTSRPSGAKPKLPSSAAGERMRQSGSSLVNLLGRLEGSFGQKQSLRFVPERPVDAHLQIDSKRAPTPNDFEPRAQTYSEASPRHVEHVPKISFGLIERFSRYSPSNFASKRLLFKSADNRRQHPRGFGKSSRSINCDHRSQQKRLHLATTSADSSTTASASSTTCWRIKLPRTVPG